MRDKGIAIITGASRGIGYCISKGLAADGYKVLLIALNQKRLQMVEEEISGLVNPEVKPECLPLDVTDHKAVAEAISRIAAKPDPIEILVNNAGIWIDGTLDESPENFAGLLNTNLVSPFVFMKEVGREMKKNGRGYIFNISSRSGKYGFPGGGLYSSSKFGLVGLSESLYREFAGCGIKVTSICPGWVNTEMAFEANTPLTEKEMIQPSDILDSIRFLLGLSQSACIRELVMESSKSVL